MQEPLAVLGSAFPHYLRQGFHVHLVNDASTWRNHAEIGQALLSPFNEAVALAVTAKINVQILLDRI
ncbi:hypothetical protein D3C84_1279470 [compost metagenome]